MNINCVIRTIVHIVSVNTGVRIKKTKCVITEVNSQGSMGVIVIADDKCTTEPITILRGLITFSFSVWNNGKILDRLTIVRMIPEGSCLIWDMEVIQERIVWCNWTLSDSDRTICPTRTSLEKTMPMLRSQIRKLCRIQIVYYDLQHLCSVA
jgi:hypothetical protein